MCSMNYKISGVSPGTELQVFNIVGTIYQQ